MAEVLQSLEDLQGLKGDAPPRRRVYEKKVDAQGRAYATGKRKNAVARVWIKPGSGKITVNDRDVDVYFARPVLRMMIQQPFQVASRVDQYDVQSHGLRRRPVRPGRRGAPRHLQGADLFRAGAARRAQEGRLPDPRLARRRAQEVRPRQGPPQLPVLEALIGDFRRRQDVQRPGESPAFLFSHGGHPARAV